MVSEEMELRRRKDGKGRQGKEREERDHGDEQKDK